MQIPGAFESSETGFYWAALFDPIGVRAIDYQTRYWTIAEQNQVLLPFNKLLIINRLIWTTFGLFVFGIIYKAFQFHQHTLQFSFKNNSTKSPVSTPSKSVTKLQLALVGFDYSVLQQLNYMWRISKNEFRFILISKPFISLLLGGVILMIVMMAAVNPRWDTDTYPMTWQMLEQPGILYPGIINALTFLYAGLLVQKDRRYNMNQHCRHYSRE